MLHDRMKVIDEGDGQGNNMIIKFEFPSGLEIMGLATKNFYGGEWDYGATWNYVVMGDKPFMVDTGRFGMGKKLLQMMESAGFNGADIESIYISHGHEDHDGGLCEALELTGANVKAHYLYDRLIRFYPEFAPRDFRKKFPAACWRCFMPTEFSDQHCIKYHKERDAMTVETIPGDCDLNGERSKIYHTPGHSPDAISFLFEREAIIVGDTILPEITPFPSTEDFFDTISDVVKPFDVKAEDIVGLRAFIRSIKKLKSIGLQNPDMVVLPAHRLFHIDHWNEFDLADRADEIIEHHIDRSSDILDILKQGPKTAMEIAEEYFDEALLKGAGALMAENEVFSHCELLAAAKDA